MSIQDKYWLEILKEKLLKLQNCFKYLPETEFIISKNGIYFVQIRPLTQKIQIENIPVNFFDCKNTIINDLKTKEYSNFLKSLGFKVKLLENNFIEYKEAKKMNKLILKKINSNYFLKNIYDNFFVMLNKEIRRIKKLNKNNNIKAEVLFDKLQKVRTKFNIFHEILHIIFHNFEIKGKKRYGEKFFYLFLEYISLFLQQNKSSSRKNSNILKSSHKFRIKGFLNIYFIKIFILYENLDTYFKKISELYVKLILINLKNKDLVKYRKYSSSEFLSQNYRDDVKSPILKPIKLDFPLKGLNISKNNKKIIVGKAKIIKSGKEKILKDEIIVAKDISKIPVKEIYKVKGVLCENGGILCHLGLNIRELGKICIINVRGLEAIKNGDVIKVIKNKIFKLR